MRFAIVTRNMNSWSSTQLREALTNHNIGCECISLPRLVARVGYPPFVRVADTNVSEELDALLIRPVGRGSIEELVFRMDILYRLQRSGLYIVNPPEAIEHCVDKYDVLTILEENGIPVPRTAVTESADEATAAFEELGRDVVVKPLFGSRGVGATRIRDAEIASTAFRTLTFYHGVIYIQEFIDHGLSDIRAFVIGNRVVAAMRRVANGWKTNYSQGGRPEMLNLDGELEETALKSAKLLGCKVAGVDILESQRGSFVVEVNSQPGWRGLQSVTSLNIAEAIIDFMLSELKK